MSQQQMTQGSLTPREVRQVQLGSSQELKDWEKPIGPKSIRAATRYHANQYWPKSSAPASPRR